MAPAIPRRWLIPSEKPPARLWATDTKPTRSMTSSTRPREIPLLWARHRRWLYAVRPPWIAFASSMAPTSNSGRRCCPYDRPSTVTVPLVGQSRPMIMRIVVDLPEPLGPRKPVTLPGTTSNDTSSTATESPTRLVRLRISIM
jgi:hypothetical protein